MPQRTTKTALAPLAIRVVLYIMDTMVRDEKNLKDSGKHMDMAVTDTGAPVSYSKANKLIMALYMVTDTIDKEEPLRIKLRTLGTDIISDMNSDPLKARKRIAEVLSFLDIAAAMSIISGMNAGILRKEFYALDQAIDKAVGHREPRQINLAEFLREELEAPSPSTGLDRQATGGARLGVQRGSTLLKSIKDMSDTIPSTAKPHKPAGPSVGGGDQHITDIQKKQRREDILNIIKIIGGSATIKDIKDRSANVVSLSSCSEKTIQRDLVSLVHEGVLTKTGDKRWSRYALI